MPHDERKCPNYEALSYTWGSSENPTIVQIASISSFCSANHIHCLIKEWGDYVRNEIHNSGSLSVTQNLAEALRHLRKEDDFRALWVDAICVNQQDLTERSQQVRRMADIYRSARQVLVWLGPGSADSSLAMDTLFSLGSQIDVDWRYRRTTVKPELDA